jgi:hypothetical protein
MASISDVGKVGESQLKAMFETCGPEKNEIAR